MPTHASTAPSAEPFSFKVLTVNIHKGFSPLNRTFMLHDLREAVRKVAADVVFLQEVQGAHLKHARHISNFPETPQYEFLADSIWQQFAYGRNAAYDHGHHGNALLSKFPIKHMENHNLSIAGPEKRGMLHCVLEVPGRTQPIHTLCVHLSLTDSHRRKQLALMCRMIQRDIPPDAPLLLAGDFNDWRNRADELLGRRLGLVEAFGSGKGRPARSFPSTLPFFRLDRIYVRGFRVRQAQVHYGAPWAQISDHAALTADLEPVP